MANGIRNALLFGGGALVAAFAVVYGLGVFTPAPAEKLAETAQPSGNSMTAKEGRVPATPQKPAGTMPVKPAGPSSQAADRPASKGDAAPAGDASAADNAAATAGTGGKAAAEPKAAASKETAGTKDVTAPSFDVVRVEGNGSIVVAGRSAPGAKVEILSGKSVLGISTAGAEGDFAIVLDDPLKPGDYQLVLRSTTPANVVAMSKETAVVSIPEHENGQVLALVESPGQPSKLITIPKPENAAPAAPADTQTGTRTGQAGASATADSRPREQSAKDAPSGEAAAPPASNDGADRETARTGSQSSGQVAEAPAEAPDNAQSSATAAQPQVSVEAVEIEGNKIFVAGIADPGSTVRVYANDTVLGEAKASPVGRFLVESIHELAVGDYIIRADMLAPDGLKVAARAAVPFTRAPGENVAAVASGEAGSTAPQDKDAGTPANPAAPAPSGRAAAAEGAQSAVTAASGGSSAGAPSGRSTVQNTALGNEAPRAVVSNGKGSAVLPSLDSDISKQPPTIVSPKLQETSGAVIIRRGDTLWQISRRVYGHGIRYSTIYLANQDQIEDPDLIWPGQIFAVPNETKEGEPADMKAIAGQVTELPKKAVE